MKIMNSRIATIAAAAVIVMVGGGTGAYAGGAIGGDSIQNGTVDSSELQNGTVTTRDIDNGTVRSADIRDGEVKARDLDPSVRDSILEGLKAGGMTDSKGALIASWEDRSDPNVVSLPGTYNAMVTLDVQVTGATAPVKVSVGDLFCVAVPVEGMDVAQCQAARPMTAGALTVTGAEAPNVSASVTVVRVN